MKKHMLKETNSMRRLMGLNLLKEESDVPTDVEIEAVGSEEEKEEVNEEEGIEDTDKGDEGDVIGAEWQADGKLDKTNIDEASMEEKDAYCQKEFGKDYADCTDKQKEQCDENCGKAMNEDSEGEETYNYGEDEGADEHREDEMEDELHHDEEDMAPHDRIKAIEDHLDALKKDMGYDEDHEDRDEEGTHFAEGKRYSKVLNTLTESQYRKLKRFIK
jgi:hypothetical protein